MDFFRWEADMSCCGLSFSTQLKYCVNQLSIMIVYDGDATAMLTVPVRKKTNSSQVYEHDNVFLRCNLCTIFLQINI